MLRSQVNFSTKMIRYNTCRYMMPAHEKCKSYLCQHYILQLPRLILHHHLKDLHDARHLYVLTFFFFFVSLPSLLFYVVWPSLRMFLDRDQIHRWVQMKLKNDLVTVHIIHNKNKFTRHCISSVDNPGVGSMMMTNEHIEKL